MYRLYTDIVDRSTSRSRYNRNIVLKRDEEKKSSLTSFNHSKEGIHKRSQVVTLVGPDQGKRTL